MRRKPEEYEGRGREGGPPPDVAEARAAAVAAGDPNAGLPTEWQGTGSKPSPTGRRRSSVPVIELGRAPSKPEVYEGLERWKARHPEAAAHLEPADVIETAMRGRAYAWYRLRLNLIHVPEALRPPQEPIDPDAAPDDRANLSDDERAAWMAGRRPSRKAAPEEDAGA